MSEYLDSCTGRRTRGLLHYVGGCVEGNCRIRIHLGRGLLRCLFSGSRGLFNRLSCGRGFRLRLGLARFALFSLVLLSDIGFRSGTRDEVLEALGASRDVQVRDGPRLEIVDPAVDEDGLKWSSFFGTFLLGLACRIACGSETVVQLAIHCQSLSRTREGPRRANLHSK